MLDEPVDLEKKYQTFCGYPVILDSISGDPGFSHPVHGRIFGMFAKIAEKDKTGSFGCWTEMGCWLKDGKDSMDLVEIL